MKVRLARNEVFAIRDGEVTTTHSSPPDSGRWLAVMLRAVEMPAGEREPARQTDDAPVEQCAVLACQINREGRWQWVSLSPATKETIGDLLFDSNAAKDCWYYVLIA